MKKIIFIISAVLFAVASNSQDFLVSPEEMGASNKVSHSLTPKLIPAKDAPVIQLLSPDLKNSITSPTNIELKFSPTEPAYVVTDSFKVFYGAFQIDITNRLMPYAEVTALGVNVKQAKLPTGSHKMTLMVTDSAGRQGFKTIEFEVK
jgi:hypothetical protein